MRSHKWLFNQLTPVLCVGFVFIMATAALSYADEVTLKGGDVIHGKVIEQNDDGVLLEHEDLGQIRIAWGVNNSLR